MTASDLTTSAVFPATRADKILPRAARTPLASSLSSTIQRQPLEWALTSCRLAEPVKTLPRVAELLAPA